VVVGPILELATLTDRHPEVELLKLFGVQLVLRLCLDPIRQPDDTRKRAVTVDWISSKFGSPRQTEVYEIGWSGLPDSSIADCTKVKRTMNEQRITEDAAIAVMALLIHELEGVSIESVLPIGSGGDYLVKHRKRKQGVQVEVSGIREDLLGNRAESRLAEKRAQVLKRSDSGYVSVTTFHHAVHGGPHSFLHFVAKRERKQTKRRDPNGKRKGK
jgi:hypothetical protein